MTRTTSPPGTTPRVFLNPDTGRFQPSVIRQMTLRADATPGAVNLSQGMPNPEFGVPEFVRRAACEAVNGPFNQYAPPVGLPALREAVATDAAGKLGFTPDPATEVTITCGATEAMYVALRCLTEPTDRVVIPTPTYENYWADCVLMNLRPVPVRLRPSGWRLDLEELRTAFRPDADGRTPRVIILCNPNNPTGTVYQDDELRVVADLCREYNAVVIADEVYERMVYEDGVDRRHRSIASYEGMRERSVTISSASKTFSVTGWRVGTVVAPAEVSANLRRAHDFITITAPAPLQAAVARAFATAGRTNYYTEFVGHYHARRELLHTGLTRAGFRVGRPEGAYYLLADISDSGLDDTAFVDRMLEEAGVAAVPASCFFDPADRDVGRRYIRFCFCKTDDMLDAAVRSLGEWGYRARSWLPT